MISLLRPDMSRTVSLEDWLRSSFSFDEPFFPCRSGLAGRISTLPADLYEDGEAFHVVLELPGVNKENLEVTLENAVLRVTGNCKLPSGSQGDRVVEFSRSLAVPDGVDPTAVSAELRDGILHLRLVKQEERKPRNIQID